MTTPMTSDQIITIADANKGENMYVRLIDGTELTGTLVSVNSKGINLKVGDRIVTRSLAKVVWLEQASSEDGYTTAQLASLFNTNARSLRVQLRKMALGVGKGHRYQLTQHQVKTVHEALIGAAAK